MHRTVSALFTPEPLCAVFTQAQTERLHCKSTTIFASCKTKSGFYLVVYKNPCTFAAKLVFHNLYNQSERNQQRLLIPLF